MANRQELHSLVDLVSDEKLERVATMLRFAVNPPPPRPELEKMREHTNEFRKQVEKRFRETGRPSCSTGGAGFIGGMGGGGHMMAKDGAAYGSHSFSYWDGEAQVQQTLRVFKGHELETMQRFSLSADNTRLIYEEEIASGGKTVRRSEEFPLNQEM